MYPVLLAGRGGQDVGEPPYQQPAVLLSALRQLVGPRVRIDGTGSEDLNFPATLARPRAILAHHGFRPTNYLGPEPRCYKGNTAIRRPPRHVVV